MGTHPETDASPGVETFPPQAKLLLGVIFLAAMAMRVLVIANSAALDDAYITFRYARNMANGLGFVYNAGERVLGTTTPLWTLFLTPIARLQLPLDTTAVILGAVLDLAVLAILWRLLSRHVGSGIAIIGACFYGSFYASVAACGYGMETQLFMLLVLLAFTGYMENRPLLAWVSAAAASLARPEGLLLATILVFPLIAQRLRRRRLTLPCKALALYAGILAVWCLLASFYFGSPFPHSVLAKRSIPGMGPSDWLDFFILRNPLLVFLWVLGFVGMGVASRSRNHLLVLLTAWTLLYLLFFLLGKPAFYAAWYFPPLALSLLPLAAVGADAMARPLIHRGTRRAWAIGLTCVLLMGFLMPRTLASTRAVKMAAREVYIPLALWVRENTRPQDLVFAGDIGYLGYFSERRMLDAAALVSPDLLNFYAMHEEDPFRDVQFILQEHPSLVVLPMTRGAYGHLRGTAFSSAYRPVRRFSLAGEMELEPAEDPALHYRKDSEHFAADYLVYEPRH